MFLNFGNMSAIKGARDRKSGRRIRTAAPLRKRAGGGTNRLGPFFARLPWQVLLRQLTTDSFNIKMNEGELNGSEAPAVTGPGDNDTTPSAPAKKQDGKEAAPSDTGSLIEPPFAQTRSFWIAFIVSWVVGGILGLVAFCYVKAIDFVPRSYATLDNPGFPSSPGTLTYLAGKPFWIGIGAATGFVVGGLKVVTKTDDWPSFAVDLREKHVQPWMSLRVFVLGMISIMGGACLGPEAGLGAAGSLGGQLAANLLERFKLLGSDQDPKQIVAAGAAASLAPLFPSPFLSTVLCGEAGGWGGSRAAALILAGASGSFAVYYSLTPESYLDAKGLLIRDVGQRTANVYDFAIGILFGMGGGVVAIVHLLIGGIIKGVFGAIKTKLDGTLGIKFRIMFTCTLSGTLYGLFSYLFPLTLGTGSELLSPVVQLGPALAPGLLVSSALIKSISFWTCTHGGLVGGMVFPSLLMGTMIASAVSTWTGLPLGLAVNCGFPVVAAAFMPMPIFWIVLTFLCFMWNQQVLFPIFTSVGIAYLVCIGLGLPQFLMSRAEQRRLKKEATMKENGVDVETAKVKKEDVARSNAAAVTDSLTAAGASEEQV